MIALTLLVAAHMGAAEDFTPRLETLRYHLSRLEAVEVPAGKASEKERRLEELRARIAAGVTTSEAFDQLYRDMDAVREWLWDNASERPSLPKGHFEDTNEVWRVVTPSLDLAVSKSDLAMQVVHGDAVWRFEPCNDGDIIYDDMTFGMASAETRRAEPFDTGYSVGMALTFADFPQVPGLSLAIVFNLIGEELVVELSGTVPARKLVEVNWPKPVVMEGTAQEQSVVPFMQGMLLPGNWEQELGTTEPCNSRALYMPWWGHIRDGHGIQLIYATSDDAGIAFYHPSGGPTVAAPKWYASLGQVGYQRVVRYVFSHGATYVTQAKRYRRFVEETGRFVSLREKQTRTPALKEVIGRPIVHLGALYHTVPEAATYNQDRVEANHALRTFDELAADLRSLKEAGIGSAYVHLDGWGYLGYDNAHPDVMPPGAEQGGWDGLRRFADTCEELNYFFAVHDQYRDFYFSATSFDDRLTVTDRNGERFEVSFWCGGPQTVMSPRFAPEYVRRNHDLFAAHGINVRGAYLDVFSVLPLEESWQPLHPITRSDCARYRRDCFDVLRARGYVVSSEEPADYLVPSLDLYHHAPYRTTPDFGGGAACGISVPLFSLVYHDSVLTPWFMSDEGGWGIPDGDAGRLHCFLNAGPPYAHPGASAEDIALVHEAMALAKHCAFLEMTDHTFLDGTYRRQRSRFSDGTEVTVDFIEKTHRIAYPAEK